MVTPALLASRAIWLWMVVASDCRAEPGHPAHALCYYTEGRKRSIGMGGISV